MQFNQSKHRHCFRPAALSLAILTAHLSYVPATVAAESVSHQQSLIEFKIAADSLAHVLNQIASTADITLTFDPTSFNDINSPGLVGTYTAKDALNQALRGHGFEAQRTQSGGYMVKKSNASQQTELQKVQVIGQQNNLTENTGAYGIANMDTATGLNLSSRETPQSVSVVSNQLIKDQNIDIVADALSLTPGLWVNAGDSGTGNVQSRGFLIRSFQLDGVVASDISPLGEFDFLGSYNTASIDHIEVVRGATGLLTGSGDPSGTVNVVRKRPTDEFQASMDASTANYGAWGGALDLSGPIDEAGALRSRAVISIDKQHDHIRGYYNESRSAFYNVTELDLTESTQLSLTLDHQEREIRGDGAEPLSFDTNGNQIDWPRSTNLAPYWNTGDIKDQSLTLNLKHNFSDDWKLDSSFILRKSHSFRFLSSVADLNGFDASTGNFTSGVSRATTNSEVRSFHLSLNGNIDAFGKEHEVLLGYTNRKQDATLIRGIEADENGNPIFTPATYNISTFDPGSSIAMPAHILDFLETTYDTREESIYANSKIQITEPLFVLLGARLSDFKQSEVSTGPFSIWFPGSEHEHNNVFLPYAGWVYEFNDQLSGYASYTENFQIQNSAAKDINHNLLDPKESTNFEAGLKAELFNNQLLASATIFKVNEDNVAAVAGSRLNGLGQPEDYYTAKDGVVTRGVEFEVAGQITPNWQIMAGYTHQEIRDPDAGPDTRISGFAKDLIKISSSYDFSNDWQGLSIGGSVDWNGGYSNIRSYTNPSNVQSYTELSQRSFAVLGAWANYEFNPNLSVQFNIENLLDEKYLSILNRNTRYGEARRFNLAMNYRF